MYSQAIFIFIFAISISCGISEKGYESAEANEIVREPKVKDTFYEEYDLNKKGHPVSKGRFQYPDPRRMDMPVSNANPELSPFVDKPKINMYSRNPCRIENCGSPLIITLMMESDDVAEVRKMAQVPQNSTLPSVKSYSGFFSINGTLGSNVFFWFFPSMEEEEDTHAPTIVRFPGGPGLSALFDIFNGIGPFRLDDQFNLLENPHTLAKTANLLYFDSPVGTGFSYTTSKEDYPTSQEEVAKSLYSALSQFLALFPKYATTRIYLFAEGYGAKYAIFLAKKIHEMKAGNTLNLEGLIMGTPYLEPEIIYKYARHLLQAGLLDESTRALINKRLNKARWMADNENFADAMDIVEETFDSPYRIPINKTYYIPYLAQIPPQYSILDVVDPHNFNAFAFFVNQPAIRQAIHVGGLQFQDGRLAYNALRNDILRSSKTDLSLIVGKYSIWIYNERFDKKTPFSLSSEMFQNIDRQRQDIAKSNQNVLWQLKPDDNVHVSDWYIRKEKRFPQVTILDSEHSVATKDVEAVYGDINRLIWGMH